MLDLIDPAVWKKEFVTDSRAVGDGRASLKYLAPYVFRVAIGDRRIVSIDESEDGGRVTFLYKKSGGNRWRRMTVDGLEFVRRFLQHVLPRGFQKVRHYGFLSPRSTLELDAVRWLIALHAGRVFVLWCAQKEEAKPPRPPIRCAQCGGVMIVLAYVPPVRGPPDITEERAA